MHSEVVSDLTSQQIYYITGCKGKSVPESIGSPRGSLSQFPYSMKWPGVLLLFSGWDANPWLQGYPNSILTASLTIIQYSFVPLGGKRHCKIKVSFQRAQNIDHAMSWSCTSWSSVQCPVHLQAIGSPLSLMLRVTFSACHSQCISSSRGSLPFPFNFQIQDHNICRITITAWLMTGKISFACLINKMAEE